MEEKTKKMQIFDDIFSQLSAEEKNVVVMEYLKTLGDWDRKRVLCSVFGIDYMDDENLRAELDKIVWTR